jgi:hypothetical protein
MVNSSSQVAKIGFPHSSIVYIGFPFLNNTFRLPLVLALKRGCEDAQAGSTDDRGEEIC